MKDAISLVIALCVLREFFWVPNKGPIVQRLALAFLVILLTACGHRSSGPTTCNSEVSPQMIIYPDQIIRKSDVARCSNKFDRWTRVSVIDDSTQFFDVFGNPNGYQPPSVSQ